MQPIAYGFPTYHTMTPRLTPMQAKATPTPQADAFTPTTSLQRQGMSIPQAETLVKVIGEQIEQAADTKLAKHISKWTGTKKRLEEVLLNYKTGVENFEASKKALEDAHVKWFGGKTLIDSAKTSLGKLVWEKEFTRIELNSLDLSDLDLSKLNLMHAHLYNADLSRTNLEGTVLAHTNLTMAKFIDAKLTNTSLISANLDNANFTGAKLLETLLSKASLYMTKWTNATLWDPKLSKGQRTIIKSEGGNFLKTSDFPDPEKI